MAFPHGRNDGFYITAEDEQEEASKSHTFLPPASSSSSSSSSAHGAYPWNDCTSGSGGAGGEQAEGGEATLVEKEHMFDKVVTPSDVGKLNRVVIPKQQAERFFPLDASTNERGLLLCFEDRTGKLWRFRYSYWNSSQSYVMTKGWSRFVKDKRLDAGDTVSFGRGVGEAGRDRLFIDWRRQPANNNLTRMQPIPLQGMGVSFAQPWPAARLFVPPPSAMYSQSFQAYGYFNRNAASSSTSGGQFLYFNRPSAAPRPLHYGVQLEGNASLPMVLDAVPVVHNHASNSKRVRLFGVNLECPDSEGEADGRNGFHASSTDLQQHPREMVPLLRFPPSGSAESSAASLQSTRKKQHSSLDLDL